MVEDPDVEQVAAALRVSMGLLVRRLRQARADGELTLPESSALARLDRGGADHRDRARRSSSRSARSRWARPWPRSRRAASSSAAPTPKTADGRVISLTSAGLQALRNRRNARTERLTQALSSGFTRSELKQLMAAAPLIERLAQSI